MDGVGVVSLTTAIGTSLRRYFLFLTGSGQADGHNTRWYGNDYVAQHHDDGSNAKLKP